MNMQDRISVIVPVFNTEEYLDVCIQSITEQTHKNLEIILVDDGSVDGSSQICDNWAKKDPRIIVIHQSNGGGGKARNSALKIATGDYVGFVDSDDYISSKMYEYLLSEMNEEIDLVECSYIETSDNKAVFRSGEEKKEYSAEEAMREHINDRRFKQIIWNKLYKKEIVEDVFFIEEKGIDDEHWTYQTIGNAKKLLYTNAVLYAYRQQKESVMHRLKTGERASSAIRAKTARHQYLKDKMPNLISENTFNIWMTCLHYGQLVLLYKDEIPDAKRVLSNLKGTLERFPVELNSIKERSFSDRLWILLLKMSFLNTCRMRNALQIGL